MKLECPYCGVKGSADDSLAGRTVSCARCEKRFVARLPETFSDERSEVDDSSKACVPSSKTALPDRTAARLTSGQSEAAALEAASLCVVCPYCQTSGRTDAGLLGQPIRCPKCEKEFAADGGNVELKKLEAVPHIDTRPWPEEVDSPKALIRENPDFTVLGVLREAWSHLDWSFAFLCWGALFVLSLCSSGISLLLSLIPTLLDFLIESNVVLDIFSTIFQMVASVASAVFTVGMSYLGVRRVAGDKVSLKTCFRGVSRYCIWTVCLASLMQMVLIWIGFLLLIVPGIYLTFAYLFGLPLVVDRGLSAWDALEVSREAVTRVWWKVNWVFAILALPVLILLCFALFSLLSAVKDGEAILSGAGGEQLMELFLKIGSPLLLAVFLILLMMPLFVTMTGVLYHHLFKSEEELEAESHRSAEKI